MSQGNQLTIVHLRITTPSLRHNEYTSRDSPAYLTVPPYEFTMIANANWHPTNPLPVEPTVTYIGSTIYIPPDVLLETYGAIVLPDGVDLDHLEVIIYDHWIIEDGSEDEE